jgi:hypothetical protein
MAGRDLLTRLADAGEEAIGRLADAPGADRLTGVANSMRDRVDELQKRVRGIDALETRIAEVERRLAALEGSSGGSRSPARQTSTTRKPAAGRKGAPGTTGSDAAKRSGTAVRKSGEAAGPEEPELGRNPDA